MRGDTASAHLLRTLAAVAPRTRVVDVACGAGAHAEALVRLGFDVWACSADAGAVSATQHRLQPLVGDAAARVTPASAAALGYPDAFADWVVVTAADTARLPEALVEAARVLVPGGWLWIEVPPAALPELAAAAEAARLVTAEAPATDTVRETVHAVYRRPGTVG